MKFDFILIFVVAFATIRFANAFIIPVTSAATYRTRFLRIFAFASASIEYVSSMRSVEAKKILLRCEEEANRKITYTLPCKVELCVAGREVRKLIHP